MNKFALPASIALFACSSLFAADSASDTVKQAITKLKAAPNYTWTTTMEFPGAEAGARQFTPRPTTGKIDKDGFAMLTQQMRSNAVTVAKRGEKVAVKVDDEWLLTSEIEPGAGGGNRAGMGRFMGRTRAPADDAENILGKVKEFKAGADGVYSGDLTEQGAKELQSFGRGRGRPGGDKAQQPPEARNAKGTAKFWIKDGMLVKYELYLEGTRTFREEDRTFKSTRTTEIKDIGATKVDMPAEARKKLG